MLMGDMLIGDMLMGEREMDNMLPVDTTAGQNLTEGIRRMRYSEAVIEGVRRRARVFVWGSIVRKTDKAPNKGTTWWFAFQGQNRGFHREGGNIMGAIKGGSILAYVGTSNAEREVTTAIVRKYRQLVRTLKQTRIEQMILSGVLSVMESRVQGYRNCRRMAINTLVQQQM